MATPDSTSGSAPLRAIIWCAVSSEEQAKDDKTSLETQERDARAFAEANGMRIVDLLIVGGFSRRFYNYPEFVEAAALDEFHDPARMLEHWRRRDFDVLIARDGSRLGREQGILGEFVARTIHGGARLYMNSGGWIAQDNYREYIAMNGYSSAKAVDQLITGQRETKLKNVARGLTVGGRPPYSHRWVRSEAGKLLRLELDESKRRLWDDLATVLLEGVSFQLVENVLYERYGHVDERTGKPFKPLFFYRLLFNPYFWGNAARGYRNDKSKHGQRIGTWAYDPAVPAPDGVYIVYDVNQATYTSEQAAQVRDELRRREASIRGTARPYRSHAFTGLLLCADCGRYMSFNRRGYRCAERWRVDSYNSCGNTRLINEKKIRAWIHARLEEMIEHDMPDLLARSDNAPDLGKRIDVLTRELDDLHEQARGLIVKQTQAHSALSSIYDEQLQAIGERIEIVQYNLTQAERDAHAQDTSAVRVAFKNVPHELADLWAWDNTAINQLLHRLMGRRRLVIKDGEIIGMTDAPPHHLRKRRAQKVGSRN